MSELIVQDKSTVETLKNNAKMMGGIIGAEEAFFQGRMAPDADHYFLEKPVMNLQNITFHMIEKT